MVERGDIDRNARAHRAADALAWRVCLWLFVPVAVLYIVGFTNSPGPWYLLAGVITVLAYVWGYIMDRHKP